VPVEGEGAQWLETFAAELEAFESAPRAEVIERVVSMNLKQVSIGRLEDSWELLLSPVWELGPDGNVVRRVFVAPSSMRAHYFEGAAAEALRHPRIADLVELIMSERRRLEGLHALYCDEDAPVLPVSTRWSREVAEVSLCLAEVARCARAGATIEAQLSGERPALKLRELEAAYFGAVAKMPVRQVVNDLSRSVLQGR
jgi:hypothetical protein